MHILVGVAMVIHSPVLSLMASELFRPGGKRCREVTARTHRRRTHEPDTAAASLTCPTQNALIKGFSDPSRQCFGEGLAALPLNQVHHETHIPTLEDQACADARFPCPHEDGGRAQGVVGSPRQGPRAPFRLARAIALPTGERASAPRPRTTPTRRTATTDHRLRGAAAFEAVFRTGTRREGRYVQLIFAPAASLPPSPMGRFGFVVSSKVMPRAVDRNRFKRVLRAKLAVSREQAAPFDLVIRVKRRVPPEARVQALSEAAALLDQVLAVSPAVRSPC